MKLSTSASPVPGRQRLLWTVLGSSQRELRQRQAKSCLACQGCTQPLLPGESCSLEYRRRLPTFAALGARESLPRVSRQVFYTPRSLGQRVFCTACCSAPGVSLENKLLVNASLFSRRSGCVAQHQLNSSPSDSFSPMLKTFAVQRDPKDMTVACRHDL